MRSESGSKPWVMGPSSSRSQRTRTCSPVRASPRHFQPNSGLLQLTRPWLAEYGQLSGSRKPFSTIVPRSGSS